MLHSKMEGCTENSHIPSAIPTHTHTCTASPLVNIPAREDSCYDQCTCRTRSLRQSPPSTSGSLGGAHPVGLDRCVRTCVPHQCPTALPQNPLGPPGPLLTPDLLSPQLYLFQMSQSWNHKGFANWLLSLKNMHLNFLHVFPWLDNSFLLSTT